MMNWNEPADPPSDKRDSFRADSRKPGNGECSPVRWMSMADSFDVRPLAINQKVHCQLARCLLIIQRAALKIRNRDQIFRHAAFARHRWSRQDTTIIKLHAHISVGR